MDFALGADQQEWHDAAVRFAREELGADLDLLGRDERREFWREGWRALRRFGIQGLPVPAEYGGRGKDLPVTIAAMEGLGYGCPDNGLIFAINASMWTNTIPILRYGTEEQKRRYLPGLCDGTLVGANGASEVEAGSDIFSMQHPRRATRGPLGAQRPQDVGHERPGGRPLRLLRDDRPVPGGARHQRLPRSPRHARLPRGPRDPQDGGPDGPDGRARLRGVRAARRRASSAAKGAGPRSSTARWNGSGGRSWPARSARCGGSSSAASSTPGRRKQFGKPIGKFQAVAHRIVAMRLRLETCRPLVYKIGWLKAQGKDATLEAAMAKLHVSECFVKNSLDAVETLRRGGLRRRERHRARPPRQRRQPDLLRDQRHPAEHHRASSCGSDGGDGREGLGLPNPGVGHCGAGPARV